MPGESVGEDVKSIAGSLSGNAVTSVSSSGGESLVAKDSQVFGSSGSGYTNSRTQDAALDTSSTGILGNAHLRPSPICEGLVHSIPCKIERSTGLQIKNTPCSLLKFIPSCQWIWSQGYGYGARRDDNSAQGSEYADEHYRQIPATEGHKGSISPNLGTVWCLWAGS